MLLPLALLALVSSPQGNEPQGSERGRTIVTRQDLATAVQRLDALLAPSLPGGSPEQRLDGKGLREANKRFDEISLLFFSANFPGAHEQIANWVNELAGAPYLPAPLRIEFEEQKRYTPLGMWPASEEDQPIRVRSLQPMKERAGTKLSARIVVSALANVLIDMPVELVFDDAGRLVPLELELHIEENARPDGDAQVSRWTVQLIEGEAALLAETSLASGPALADARERIETQLATIEIEDEMALRVLRSRLKRLDDTPSPALSRNMLFANDDFARAVQQEADALIAGRDPYRGATGDLWRTVARGRRELPVRVYCPKNLKGPAPLVIALHGAGGDENFLFELAGDGYLMRLADAHGFVVACPATSTVATPESFGALVSGLRADYDLAPEPPLLFGHSMGGGVASTLLRLRPSAIQSAVCFAGFGRLSKDSAPTLVLAAEFDLIASASRLERGAAAAAAMGAPVTFEVLKNQGHTLGLSEAFERAVEFWGL